MKKIRILIADDHPLLRDGIKQLFGECREFTVVGETADGHSTVAEARRLKPDVVVMDITMPGLDGIDATRSIVEAVPSTKVLILSMHKNRQYVMESFRAGASGYMLKGSEGRDLLAAVNRVLDGGRYISPMVADDLLDVLVGLEKKEDGPLDKLSAREREAFELIAHGSANREIAGKLGISLSMVKKYKNKIMKKLDVKNTAGLIRLAFEEGVIKGPD